MLARIFFTLPEPIGVPDGYQAILPITDQTDLPDGLFVSLIFHQVTSSHGRTSAAAQAVSDVLQRVSGVPKLEIESDFPETTSEWTVVEAMTPCDSPEEISEEDASFPAHWKPEEDIISRCLYAAREVVRAYRQTVLVPCELPSYQRLSNPILFFTSKGAVTSVQDSGLIVVQPTQEVWDGPTLVLLDHWNLPDPVRSASLSENDLSEMERWGGLHRQFNPLTLRRERWIEARRCHEVLGEEGQAVVLANTSCETLLDVTLALLLWEEGVGPKKAAEHFSNPKIMSKIKQGLEPRLGGNWSTKKGAIGDWFERTYRLRHKVVHGGYCPTVKEASLAIAAAQEFQQVIFDRIAAKRTRYSRSAMLTIGIQGLNERGLWSGQIRRFVDEKASSESNWADSFNSWYARLLIEAEP